jgi:hypothetical protein
MHATLKLDAYTLQSKDHVLLEMQNMMKTRLLLKLVLLLMLLPMSPTLLLC